MPIRRGARPTPRNLRRIVLLLAGVSLLLVLDVWRAHQEMNGLLNAVEDSERAMVQFQEDVQAYADSAEFTELETAEPWEREAAIEGVKQELMSVSADGAVRVKEAGAEVEQVSILPWHSELLEARDAYLAHNNAWQTQLLAAARDITALDDQTYSAEIAATFRISRNRFEDAKPWLATPRMESRIEDVFASAEED